MFSENNPVIRHVYDLEDLGSSSSSPRLWRYRVRVSIDHLTHTLEQNLNSCGPNQFSLLREFLKQVLFCYNPQYPFFSPACSLQESKLRALQYLPDVVKLQRLLMSKYDRRISLQEARTFRVGQFLSSIQDRM